jgi:hypothetical protein
LVGNEEQIARLEGIAAGSHAEPAGIPGKMGGRRAEMSEERGQISDPRTEIRSTRQDLQAEIRSTRNTTLMVNPVLWMGAIGTRFGLFFGFR